MDLGAGVGDNSASSSLWGYYSPGLTVVLCIMGMLFIFKTLNRKSYVKCLVYGADTWKRSPPRGNCYF